VTDDGGEDDTVFAVLDEYGVEYQRELRHGRKWVQVRAGSEIGVHIVDGLRAFGYRLHSFASYTTMNFVKVNDNDKRGVRGRQEIEEKLEELKERDSGVVYEGTMGSIPARCTGEIRALSWVLGEVDDL